MLEIEVKFININPETIQTKLKEIGAEKVGEYFYRRRVFDYPDYRLAKEHAWLRLRDEGEKITLTFKKRLGAESIDGTTNDTGMEELEVEVSDFDKTTELILSVGMIEKHYLENRRIRWQKDGVEFDIDTYPLLEPFLEIEAKSWEKIDEAIDWLGLDPKDKKIFSGWQVYKLKGIILDEYARLTFNEVVKKQSNN